MADKKLNAVSTASDGAYIYAEDASGNQIKISKADLASVVAGVMPSKSKLLLTENTTIANTGGNTGTYRRVAIISSGNNGLCSFLLSGVSYGDRTYSLAFCSITKNVSVGVSGVLSIIAGNNKARLFYDYKAEENIVEVYATFDHPYGRMSIVPLIAYNCVYEYGSLENISETMTEISAN